ncbi:hypothetical protein L2E82_29357 [Cichorium intybus]|uniref:Uncharacterized protein n=1 Tax=Cichorium intybus TaxID=13427 RepID=A0ACB9CXE8_CICIN|nr:hypothetical protein L2E82_29357 [Cichorium intybus]
MEETVPSSPLTLLPFSGYFSSFSFSALQMPLSLLSYIQQSNSQAVQQHLRHLCSPPSLAAVSSPLVILHGAANKVTYPNINKFVYEKVASKDKSLKFYDGSYHCILECESDERIFEVLDDIIAWLDSHCNLKVVCAMVKEISNTHSLATGSRANLPSTLLVFLSPLRALFLLTEIGSVSLFSLDAPRFLFEVTLANGIQVASHFSALIMKNA